MWESSFEGRDKSEIFFYNNAASHSIPISFSFHSFLPTAFDQPRIDRHSKGHESSEDSKLYRSWSEIDVHASQERKKDSLKIWKCRYPACHSREFYHILQLTYKAQNWAGGAPAWMIIQMLHIDVHRYVTVVVATQNNFTIPGRTVSSNVYRILAKGARRAWLASLWSLSCSEQNM